MVGLPAAVRLEAAAHPLAEVGPLVGGHGRSEGGERRRVVLEREQPAQLGGQRQPPRPRVELPAADACERLRLLERGGRPPRLQLAALECARLALRHSHGLTQAHLGHHQLAELGQQRDVVVGPVPRHRRHHTQGAEAMPVGVEQRHARVRGHRELRDRRVRPQQGVLAGVAGHDRLSRRDDVLAEGVGDGQLVCDLRLVGEAALALDELALGGHERHRRERRAEPPAGQLGEAVERLLGRRVEQPRALEGRDPRRIAEDVIDLLSVHRHRTACADDPRVIV